MLAPLDAAQDVRQEIECGEQGRVYQCPARAPVSAVMRESAADSNGEKNKVVVVVDVVGGAGWKSSSYAK